MSILKVEFLYKKELKRMSRRIRTEEALDKLEQLGFSKYGSRAYLAIVKLGSGTASEIAKEADIPQAKIYGVLDSLYEDGFIGKDENATPATYIAHSPKKTFQEFLSGFSYLAKFLDDIFDSASVSSKYGFYTVGNFTDKLQATDFLYVIDMSENLYDRFFVRELHNYFKVAGPTNSLAAIGEKNTVILIEKEGRVQYICIEDPIFSRMVDTIIAIAPVNRNITEEMAELTRGEKILYIDSIISADGAIYGQYGTIWITPTRILIKIPGKEVYARPIFAVTEFNVSADGGIELIVRTSEGDQEMSHIYTNSDPKVLQDLVGFVKETNFKE